MTKVPKVVVGERIEGEFLNDRQEVMKRANGAERRSIRRAAKATG